ncbi:hypothetical protein BWQ96_00956 [Gracilariopsis chorda]|uniref:Uncharacterized protein n=1 Tax=Gracilariopsis chorda TaxID=448386 RepID=A0A2V3J588_9FLOR|nr:hypothetical protein BWQ96_00956 [Gracilariopsis chorda]|eukprot:PXF49167.1 hypothetical protein BWQ96_00956 [Gracilariopsis chorda]
MVVIVLICIVTTGFQESLLLGDWRIILFPVLSVGVNSCFVWLLKQHGGDPYTKPQVALNAVCHIAHDLLGTEAGLLVLTAMVYYKGRDAKRRESKRS